MRRVVDLVLDKIVIFFRADLRKVIVTYDLSLFRKGPKEAVVSGIRWWIVRLQEPSSTNVDKHNDVSIVYFVIRQIAIFFRALLGKSLLHINQPRYGKAQKKQSFWGQHVGSWGYTSWDQQMWMSTTILVLNCPLLRHWQAKYRAKKMVNEMYWNHSQASSSWTLNWLRICKAITAVVSGFRGTERIFKERLERMRLQITMMNLNSKNDLFQDDCSSQLL